MNKVKEEICIEKISELLKKAPTDDGTFYGSIYDLNVFIGIVKGTHDIINGNGTPFEEFKKEMEELHERTLQEYNNRRFSKK